jgi:hypothetical protein
MDNIMKVERSQGGLTRISSERSFSAPSMEKAKMYSTAKKGRLNNQLASLILEDESRGLVCPQLPPCLPLVLPFLAAQEKVQLISALEPRINGRQKRGLLLRFRGELGWCFGLTLRLMSSASLCLSRRPLLYK